MSRKDAAPPEAANNRAGGPPLLETPASAPMHDAELFIRRPQVKESPTETPWKGPNQALLWPKELSPKHWMDWSGVATIQEWLTEREICRSPEAAKGRTQYRHTEKAANSDHE